jgi:SAM-dependent methyltransferase
MRFEFGSNWRSFLNLLDERRIEESVRAIQASLRREDLTGLNVLDIGSGSGLSSLAMHRMGANVTSFDYDEISVSCTKELRERFAARSATWNVMQGSVLDDAFMADLGTYDIVYAWGVLHHTGAMWRAVELSAARVSDNGYLLIALYNDQGWRSHAWSHIKRAYCSGAFGRIIVKGLFYPLFAAYALMLDIRNRQLPGSHARNYAERRGMSLIHDWRDWLGGYPFEVASPEAVRSFLRNKGFEVESQKLTRGWGCSEFVLAKVDVPRG